jgi:hypothetical protein
MMKRSEERRNCRGVTRRKECTGTRTEDGDVPTTIMIEMHCAHCMKQAAAKQRQGLGRMLKGKM